MSDAGDTFQGFPPATFAFLGELAEHNDTAWFRANRQRYERDVAAPMRALLREFEGAFGPSALFRPYRDLRFTSDRRPLKESVAGHLGPRRRTGMRTVHLTGARLAVRVGCRPLTGDALRAYRRSVQHPEAGAALERIRQELDPSAGQFVGRTLARGPRGAPKDAPRRELLCHTYVAVRAEHAIGPWIHDPDEVIERVAPTLAAGEPLLAWLAAHIHSHEASNERPR